MVTSTVSDPADSNQTELSGWPLEKTVFLTLDLECDYGTAIATNSYDATGVTRKLARLLERYDVPLTCFLQTELLDEYPEAVWALADSSQHVEFHAHSHTHPTRNQADVEAEVRRSVEHVRDTFGTDPAGFRFPDGAARSTDYRVLADNGVAFDASLFPSVRPGRFNNLDQPLCPFRHEPTGIIELPFTVYSPWLRVPVSLSYLKLFGRPFEQLISRFPPPVVVFDMHMHDVVVPSSFEDLPRQYQLIYSRQKHRGFEILDRFIETFLEHGYTFDVMSTLFHETTNALPTTN